MFLTFWDDKSSQPTVESGNCIIWGRCSCWIEIHWEHSCMIASSSSKCIYTRTLESIDGVGFCVCQPLMESKLSMDAKKGWRNKKKMPMIHFSVGCYIVIKHRKWCSVILNDWTINISLGLRLLQEEMV